MADLNGGLIYANPALLRLLGIDSLAEAVGMYVTQFYPVQARDYFEHEVLPMVLQRGAWTGEINLLSRSGEEVPVLNNIFLVRDEADKPLYIANVLINMTERKEYERKLQDTLRETERLYRTVSREGWEMFQAETQMPAFVFEQEKVTALASTGPYAHTPATAGVDHEVKRVPIAVRGQVIGTVIVDDDPTRPLSPEEEDLLKQIADQGAVALETARLFVLNQRDAMRESSINRIANRLRNARTVDEVLTIAVQELRTTTHAARSVLEIKPHVEPAASSGDGGQARS
jgi:PAS domain S-box-containing protein